MLVNRGELPGYRFGRVIRMRRADFNTYVKARRIDPGDLDHLVNLHSRVTPPKRKPTG